MTWTKLGTEFFDQLAETDLPDDLEDACQLTHTQAIHYLYSLEEMELTFKKAAVQRFATSRRAQEAAGALVAAGFWKDIGTRYQLVHHADVIRQSLGYQLKERERSKAAKAKARASSKTRDVTQDVTRDGTQDVTRDGMRPQTDRQTAFTEGSSLNTQTSDPAASERVSTWEVASIPKDSAPASPASTTQFDEFQDTRPARLCMTFGCGSTDLDENHLCPDHRPGRNETDEFERERQRQLAALTKQMEGTAA